ncbi:MAG: hypothetical protein WEA54_06240, partial [Actinomycetota bacterium]
PTPRPHPPPPARPRGEPAPPATEPDPGAVGRSDPSAAHAVAAPTPVPLRRTLRHVLVPATVLLVAGAFLASTLRPAGRTDGAAVPSGGGPGVLLYSSDDDPDRTGIYRLDLESGSVTAGQPLPGVYELVRIADGLGSIGVTRLVPDGTRQAFTLSAISANARVFPIAIGDMISWGPRGLSVVSVDAGSDRRCRSDVSVEVVELAGAPARSTVFRTDRLCGDILAAGRDLDRTYLSIARGEVVRTSWTSPARVLHREVPHRVIGSVSPTGDMIVTPVRFLSSGYVPGRNPDPGPIAQLAGGSELAWRGRGDPAPIVDDRDGTPLQVQRTLAWTPDGSHALTVAGPLEGEASIYEVPGGVGEGAREAHLMWRVEGPIGGATYADDGSIYLVMERQMIRIEDGELSRVEIPEDAPLPTGAVLWLPSPS